jgi:hypothetical protein
VAYWKNSRLSETPRFFCSAFPPQHFSVPSVVIFPP